MARLIIRDERTGDESTAEFDTPELAVLYRDYHIIFGHWSAIARWVNEKDLKPEQEKFVVEEKTELFEGEIIRLCKVVEGIEIKLEKEVKNPTQKAWDYLRTKRNRMLQMTDWTQLPDTDLDTEARKDYRSYRSYLRVLPKLFDDATVVNAKVYSFEDWKKGKR